jgi:hypothetical protein
MLTALLQLHACQSVFALIGLVSFFLMCFCFLHISSSYSDIWHAQDYPSACKSHVFDTGHELHYGHYQIVEHHSGQQLELSATTPPPSFSPSFFESILFVTFLFLIFPNV